MPEQSGRGPAGSTHDADRFDGESTRRILQRAAAEQQRLKKELEDSYSLEELEQMAAEAGISPEALKSAVETEKSGSGTAAAGKPHAPSGRPQRRPTEVRGLMPGHWFRTTKGMVLTTAGGVAFLGSLLAFPAFAEAVLWVLLLLLIALAVLIALGASPF